MDLNNLNYLMIMAIRAQQIHPELNQFLNPINNLQINKLINMGYIEQDAKDIYLASMIVLILGINDNEIV